MSQQTTNNFPESIQSEKSVDDFPDREEFDAYIGTQVVLPSKGGDDLVFTKVVSRKRDSDGKVNW